MSQIGGTVGGKIGNSQNPYFTSPGGVTPQESSLAQYDYGQNLLEALAQFEPPSQPGGGASMSTMATQGAGGANVGRALDLTHASDTNQAAQYGASTNANAIQAANQGNQLQQISSLSKLAGAASGSDFATGASTAASGGTG